MKAVLFIEHACDIGGGQIVFIELVSAAVEAGMTVGIAYPEGGRLEKVVATRFAGYAEAIGVPEIRMTNGSKSLSDGLRFAFSWAPFVRHWRRLRRYPLWYVNGGRVLLAVAVAALFCQRRIVYHAHNAIPSFHNRVEKLLLLVLGRVGLVRSVVCPSHFQRSDFVAFNAWFARSGRCAVIENPLGRAFDSLPFIDRFGPGHESVRFIGVVGKVSPLKGHDIVCEVARRLPDIRFHFVGGTLPGDEVYVDELKRTAPPNVVFVGEVSDVRATIDALGIQVSLVPSRMEESFGLVAIESMACSCITLGSGRGALPEIARLTGMLVFDIDAPGSLESSLRDLLSRDKRSLFELARNQHQRTTMTYSLARFKSKVTELLTAS
jgi:glycosyltransferase involved in cell wall biosynthesis